MGREAGEGGRRVWKTCFQALQNVEPGKESRGSVRWGGVGWEEGWGGQMPGVSMSKVLGRALKRRMGDFPVTDITHHCGVGGTTVNAGTEGGKTECQCYPAVHGNWRLNI